MAIDEELLLPEESFTDKITERQYIISPLKFLMLNALSFGFYTVWWIYKVWRFLIQRKNSDANAAIRTLFDLFYFIPRCYQILKLAKNKGYTKTYSPVLLFLFSFSTLLCSVAPPPLFFLWILSGLFSVQPLMAFNFVLSQSPEVDVVIDRGQSVTEIVIIVLGSIVWLSLILGTLAMIFA